MEMDEQTTSNVMSMNVVPDGIPAWLSYTEHRQLKTLILALDDGGPSAIAALWGFLVNVSKLKLPANASDEVVRFNAYTLMRRGYIVESLTEAEYLALKVLYLQAEPTDVDDMDLHETGTHRALYNMLTRTFGFEVEAGRGPVWRRAQKLLNHNGPSFERTT